MLDMAFRSSWSTQAIIVVTSLLATSCPCFGRDQATINTLWPVPVYFQGEGEPIQLSSSFAIHTVSKSNILGRGIERYTAIIKGTSTGNGGGQPGQEAPRSAPLQGLTVQVRVMTGPQLCTERLSQVSVRQRRGQFVRAGGSGIKKIIFYSTTL